MHSEGYYETSGEWILGRDRNFEIIASQVRDLGGKSILELGCSTGQVLKELVSRGWDVNGIEASHLNMFLATSDIRSKIFFGDILDLKIDGRYDVILGMDIFEHLNPLKIDRYIAACSALLADEGVLFFNSPIFGEDRIFGTAFPIYLKIWEQSCDGLFRHLEADDLGWPRQGHLVWARSDWWEAAFLRHGLVRDEGKEVMLQTKYEKFFKQAPARKAIFVLRRSKTRGDTSHRAQGADSRAETA